MNFINDEKRFVTRIQKKTIEYYLKKKLQIRSFLVVGSVLLAVSLASTLIIPNSNANAAGSDDVLYGMTIREAAMLIAKEDRNEFLSRLKQDREKENSLKEFLSKNNNDLKSLPDNFFQKESRKEIHLTKDESLVFEKIEQELINNIQSARGENAEQVNAESLLYGIKEGDRSSGIYPDRGWSDCQWNCFQNYPDIKSPEFLNCSASCVF